MQAPGLLDDAAAHLQADARRARPQAQGRPFGDTIVYDAERCIACTRCIRFCDEVVGDHMLDLRERGNKNEVVLAQGRKLEGDYTS